ncbi:MAG: biopolymer transporter ExbD [Gemmataceae bacterium]
MAWRLRHQGSPQSIRNLTFEQIVQGLRDGVLDPTDEVQSDGETAWQAIENHPQLAEIAEEAEPQIAPKHADEATSIDMNALIDVCMVLLIFFILTTSYVAVVQKVVPLSGTREGKGVRVVKAAEVKNKMVRLQASLDPGGKLAIRVENQTIDATAPMGTSTPTSSHPRCNPSSPAANARRKCSSMPATSPGDPSSPSKTAPAPLESRRCIICFGNEGSPHAPREVSGGVVAAVSGSPLPNGERGARLTHAEREDYLLCDPLE